MLAPTHVAVGYMCGTAMSKLAWNVPRESRLRRTILVVTMVFSILPDIDVIWMLIQGGTRMLGDQAGAHHAYFTHFPLFYVAAAGILTLVTVMRPHPWRLLIAAALVGALSHFVLDSFLIGWGVKWLYPFSDKFFGWNVVTRRYRSQWGDQWLAHYLVHPFALVEYGLIAAATALAWSRRRSQDSPGKGFTPL